MTVFEAYITNLGKYAEGQFVGETLKFPATTEEVQSLLKNIGVDGVRYEEFFITAFDGDVMGLYDYLTEYENLDELNHLAHLISELDSDEIETLEAVLNKGDHTSSVADIINLVHNLDCYSLHPGVTDDETLGRIYVEDMELLDVPDNVLPYVQRIQHHVGGFLQRVIDVGLGILPRCDIPLAVCGGFQFIAVIPHPMGTGLLKEILHGVDPLNS